ncbi:transposase, partial [Proteus mirabilis]|uniref:transposase n=1 Tax=Proteus mirabilis TaxID=584 RepID=UPI002016955F
SNLVNSLKGVSSRLLRRDRPDIAQRDYYKGVLWSPSYFAGSCGGAPISLNRLTPLRGDELSLSICDIDLHNTACIKM